jgi:hypothetical protein
LVRCAALPDCVVCVTPHPAATTTTKAATNPLIVFIAIFPPSEVFSAGFTIAQPWREWSF